MTRTTMNDSSLVEKIKDTTRAIITSRQNLITRTTRPMARSGRQQQPGADICWLETTAVDASDGWLMTSERQVRAEATGRTPRWRLLPQGRNPVCRVGYL